MAEKAPFKPGAKAGNAKYSDCPQVMRDFLTYIDTIRGKSQNTAMAYYSDLRTYFRFLKVHFGIAQATADFFSSDPTEAIESLKAIEINDVTLELISSVTLSDLYEYMAYLNRTRLNNASSRARKVASLKSFYKYLHKKVGVIEKNPTEELESPKIGKKMPAYLTLDDSLSLLSSVNGKNKERDYLILTLFLNCGMRLSELVGINIDSVRGNRLTVIGKGNKERVVYLNPACMSALEAYLAVRPVDAIKDRKALFLNKDLRRLGIRGVQNIVEKYIKQAGLDSKKYSTHKLRHTAATLMYKHGNVDIRALQEILGHQNLSTTEIYTHIDDERLRNAAEQNPLAHIKPE